jgi:hypothetical protein
MKQRVVIHIPADPTQGITTRVEGVCGDGCKSLTAPIERALGRVVKDEKTAEYHQIPQQNHQHLDQTL